MANSLQDQLLKAGLVNTQKHKQVRTDKRKEIKQSQGNPKSQDELRQRVQTEVAAKAQRDRELNLKRQEELKRREEENSIRQFIHSHRIARPDGDIAYNFQDGERLRRIYVTAEQQRFLVSGRLALVRQDAETELVPREVAEKLMTRDAGLVLVLNQQELRGKEVATEEDPYAAYQIPDDLVW